MIFHDVAATPLRAWIHTHAVSSLWATPDTFSIHLKMHYLRPGFRAIPVGTPQSFPHGCVDLAQNELNDLVDAAVDRVQRRGGGQGHDHLDRDDGSSGDEVFCDSMRVRRPDALFNECVAWYRQSL